MIGQQRLDSLSIKLRIFSPLQTVLRNADRERRYMPKKQTDELKVFISKRESKCDERGEDLGRHAWITFQDGKGAVCLTCADLDHLVLLPSGDATLTRRSRKHSGLFAVVLKWSHVRKCYERQGFVVENEALGRAEQECSADADLRKARREQAARREKELDEKFISHFASRVRELYRSWPARRECTIAGHAYRKYGGRVGDAPPRRPWTRLRCTWPLPPMSAIPRRSTTTSCGVATTDMLTRR